MEITNQALEWDTDDVLNFGAFLRTRTGSRMLPKLLESTPSLLKKGDINEILIRTGEVSGFQLAAQTLFLLTAVAPAETTEQKAYPDLHDDKAWSDGEELQKSTEPNQPPKE